MSNAWRTGLFHCKTFSKPLLISLAKPGLTAQSIIDWRYNDGRDRFPLWALGYWQKMAEDVEKQMLWKRSCRWLQTESAKRHKTEELPHLIAMAQETLNYLGWDVSLQYQHGAVSSSTLSAYYVVKEAGC
jgi:hypothetical protein